mmetsp:Transcript_51689/g.121282  ORF Transcript_51689/g.121282 Transcript_51689/m.121282 type:complete len:240 (+) Transcript_51689:1119-1838(+)
MRQQADGHVIVGAEDGGRQSLELQQRGSGVPAGLVGEVAGQGQDAGRVQAVLRQLAHEAGQAGHVVGRGGGAGDDGDVPVPVLQQRAGRLHAALQMVGAEALRLDAGELAVQHDHLAGGRAHRLDVGRLDGVGQHDEAVAVAVEQEAHAVVGFDTLVRAAFAEGHHHVQALGAQREVDGAQDLHVEAAAQEGDVDPDQARPAGAQRACRLRGPEVELGDDLAHPLGRGRRDRTVAADDA